MGKLRKGVDEILEYRQVMLYALRTPVGHDILEGSEVQVYLADGESIIGVLDSVDRDEITVRNMLDDVERIVSFSDIKNIVDYGGV